MTDKLCGDALQSWHDRLGAMIDQVGHPDYSLREMVDGMRQIRDEMIVLRAAPPTTKPSGEAVAWIWHYRDGHKSLRWRPDHDPGSQDVPEMGVTPLYTHPSPTKEPDPCSIEGMIASERRKEGPK